LKRDGDGEINGGRVQSSEFRLKVLGVQILGLIWLWRGKSWLYLGSFGFSLGSFWVRFFKIVNNDGQSLGSFFGKNIFAGQESEVRSLNPELGGTDAIMMN
jgi:hypothetical protein